MGGAFCITLWYDISMKRLTVTIDDKSAQTLAEFASLSACSQASVVRSLLAAVSPTLQQSVDLYKRAQDCGNQSVQVLQRAAARMDSDIMPKQQAFLRDWNALLARTSEDIEKAVTDGHDESSDL